MFVSSSLFRHSFTLEDLVPDVVLSALIQLVYEVDAVNLIHFFSNSIQSHSDDKKQKLLASSSQEKTPIKYPGITSPISLSGPLPLDIELSKKLEETMKPFGVFESEAELSKRLGSVFEDHVSVAQLLFLRVPFPCSQYSCKIITLKFKRLIPRSILIFKVLLAPHS